MRIIRTSLCIGSLSFRDWGRKLDPMADVSEAPDAILALRHGLATMTVGVRDLPLAPRFLCRPIRKDQATHPHISDRFAGEQPTN